MICGDFNARTASDLDCISIDSSKYLPLFDSYKNDDNIRARNSHDVILDARGKELLELCISNQMRIANGRCFGDFFGRFTCYNPLGQSTVDYLMASESIYSQILYFRVSDFIPFLSDCHCKISWDILAMFRNICPNKVYNMTHELPTNYTWKKDSSETFQEALNSHEIQEKIKLFQKKSKSLTSNDIDEAVKDLNDIILSAAKLSLSKPKYRKRKEKSKKWFDLDLKKMRGNVLSQGKLYSKFPKKSCNKGSLL